MDVEKLVDKVVSHFIGTKHERDIKRIMPLVAQINALELEMKNLSDAEMAAKTPVLKAQVTEALADADPKESDYRESSPGCTGWRAGSRIRAGARSGPPHG